MRSKKYIKVDINDYNRILLTETIPFEVPIIFSNVGFYKHLSSDLSGQTFLNKISAEISSKSNKYTIPLPFKIKKNSNSFRKLSLIHPRSQVGFLKFYKENEDLLCHFSSKSVASLRYISKVATRFYSNPGSRYYFLKSNRSITTSNAEFYRKFSTSYFTYEGFSRLYKFFDSDILSNLEKKYPYMLSIDVSKCFDSIYTHSICWAVKNKTASKKETNLSFNFGAKFDKIMQKANYNETNGIVIGPEVSRIFSEIIFNDIDSKVITFLETRCGLQWSLDYEFRRYVDDIFIFSKSETTTNTVLEEYQNQLSFYKLHINDKKIERSVRPFFNAKSRVIFQLKKAINSYFSALLSKDEKGKTIPQENIQRKINNSFVNEVKFICTQENHNFETTSSFVTSACLRKTLEIADTLNSYVKSGVEFDQFQFQKVLTNLLEVSFYFYTTEPSMKGSYDVSALVAIVSEASRKLQNISEDIIQLIYDLCMQVLTQKNDKNTAALPEQVAIEDLNLVISLRELKSSLRIPENILRKIFNNLLSIRKKRERICYFDIMTILFYIQNDHEYSILKSEIQNIITVQLEEIANLFTNSEICYLFLDCICCPYLDLSFRENLIKRYLQAFDQSAHFHFDALKVGGFFQTALENEWFIKWSDVDILEELEKRQIHRAY